MEMNPGSSHFNDDIFWIFGVTRPWIEHQSPDEHSNHYANPSKNGDPWRDVSNKSPNQLRTQKV